MSKHNLPGLSPLWLISLSLVLGCWIVVSIPASIATGEAIKSSDWIGFGGNVVAGAMTLTAGIIAWFSVKGQIEAQEIAHARAQAELTTDLASILYAELAHLLARCCFDSESPWKDYWPESASVDKMDEARLRKFVPVDPVIYLATAGQLPLLGGAAQHLMEFQHRLSALRREIVNIANQAHLSNKVIEGKDVKLVARRYRETLRPGSRALGALAPMVQNAEEIEALARALYYESRPNEDLKKTLKQRVDDLLQIA